MRDLSPEDRQVFTEEATELYESAVAQGCLRPDDPRITGDAPLRPAFDLLVRIGLLVLDTDTDTTSRWSPAQSRPTSSRR
ncbi:MAG: hypothetical protein R2731_00130 [Nocardioides sp.]